MRHKADVSTGYLKVTYIKEAYKKLNERWVIDVRPALAQMK